MIKQKECKTGLPRPEVNHFDAVQIGKARITSKRN